MAEKKRSPTISDVIYEVQRLDLLKKDTPEYKKAHEKTVKVIVLANSFHGKGWISISKTRSLLQRMRDNKSGVFMKKKEDKK